MGTSTLVLMVAMLPSAVWAPPAAAGPAAGVHPVPPATAGGTGAVRLPIAFEPDPGQSDDPGRFLARGPGHQTLVTPGGADFVLERPVAADGRDADQPSQRLELSRVSMRVSGANPSAAVEGVSRLAGISNHLIGNDPRAWRTGIPTYQAVAVRSILPGTDLLFHGHEGDVEYDFTLNPGADPDRLVLAFQGASSLRLDRDGNLLAETPLGAISHHRPIVYQPLDGRRLPVSGSWDLRPGNQVSFRVGDHDPHLSLVIDPTVAYSTTLGGSGNDRGTAIASDSSGSTYVTGSTTSPDFPLSSPAQPQNRSAGCQLPPGVTLAIVTCRADAFVAKLDPGGSIIYSTYLGGALTDVSRGIAVDAAGNAYITGTTTSPDFPVTPTALQPIFNSGGYDAIASDAFISKLDPTGSRLLYSTFLGGTGTPSSNPGTGTTGGYDEGHAIAVDASGDAYVTGRTDSPNFPITPTAYQPFLNILPGVGALPEDPSCFRLSFACYDAFVTEIDTKGVGPGSLVYSTFLGGGGDDSGNGIALRGDGAVYLTGETASPDFPTTAGGFQPAQVTGAAQDAFVAVLRPAPLTALTADRASQLLYGSHLGGPGYTTGDGIAVDRKGVAHVTGSTELSNGGFPTRNAAQPQPGSCPPGADCLDAVVAAIDPSATGQSSLLYSTYLGGANEDEGLAIAGDAQGDACIAGQTFSTDFPTSNAIQTSLTVDPAQPDGPKVNPFVTCYDPSGAPFFSTYLALFGEIASGISMDAAGSLYLTGGGLGDPGVMQNFHRSQVFVEKLLGGPLPRLGSFSGDASAIHLQNVTSATLTGPGPAGSITDRQALQGGLGLCEAGPVQRRDAGTVEGAGLCGSVPTGLGLPPGATDPALTLAMAGASVQTQGSPSSGSVLSTSTLASFSLLPGTPLPAGLGLPARADVLRATLLSATSAASCTGGASRHSSSSSVASLEIAGVTVATRPVGSRLVLDPTGTGRPLTLYGTPIVVNPTGARIPMAIVTLNYSQYDPVANREISSPVAVDFPARGPLSALITGRIFLAYAEAGCG